MWLLVFFILSVGRPSPAGAEEDPAYARLGYALVTKNGQRFTMVTLTRVTNVRTCQSLLDRIEMPSHGWERTSADCFAGESYDALYVPVFDNRPGPAVYLAYQDRHGWQTRVNFGAAPPAVAEALAKTAVDSLKTSGIRDVSVIYPE